MRWILLKSILENIYRGKNLKKVQGTPAFAPSTGSGLRRGREA